MPGQGRKAQGEVRSDLKIEDLGFLEGTAGDCFTKKTERMEERGTATWKAFFAGAGEWDRMEGRREEEGVHGFENGTVG